MDFTTVDKRIKELEKKLLKSNYIDKESFYREIKFLEASKIVCSLEKDINAFGFEITLSHKK